MISFIKYPVSSITANYLELRISPKFDINFKISARIFHPAVSGIDSPR